MTRLEILDMVKRVVISEESEEVIDALVLQLRAAVPHAKIGDIIFYSDLELTPEQIVDEALRREQDYAAKNA